MPTAGGGMCSVMPHELTLLSFPPSLPTLGWTSGNIHEREGCTDLLGRGPVTAGEEERVMRHMGMQGESGVFLAACVLRTGGRRERARSGRASC